ncbi:hypothetical protein E6O75_ATG05591 [Venturia nashicola]|uniref:HMG box domain-containing protein n=1 Tax=Venturia nashicola TaxID=86259 RepID=A0A4Z1P7Z9_9PEZI|nr:hypothetical protein E6O75_ATG05591 [Venturia nashicola]
MESLKMNLKQLGLAQYAEALVENGFEDWATVLDITEDDLDELGFKLGHRRILQREIALQQERPTLPGDRRTPSTTPTENEAISPTTAAENLSNAPEKRTKRRYRWHPRADPNAPKRPKTAYVNFADHLRTDSQVAGMTFVDIAREVGRQWQVMHAAVKQEWENQAAAAMQSYEDQMDSYRKTKSHQDYQDYLQSFKKAPGKSARQKPKSDSPRRTCSQTDGMHPLSSPSLSTDYVLQIECRKAFENAMFELRRLKMEYNDMQPYSPHDLPPEEMCKHAIDSLVEGAGPLMHFFSLPAATRVISRAYHSRIPPNNLTVSELCVAAAAGAQLDTGRLPQQVVRKLLASTFMLLDTVDIDERSYLRVMRILLCLSTHSVLRKHLSARTFITAGLSIAEWQYPKLLQRQEPKELREDWRKVYRSLIFMECWLSSTLGYPPHDISVHIKNAVECSLFESTIDNAIQWQAVQVSIIGSDISTGISQPQELAAEHFRYFADQLDLWQVKLPPALQLSNLLSSPGSSNLGSAQERSMLLAHLLHLGAITMLYRQFLISAEGTLYASQSLTNFTTAEIYQYRQDAQFAAIQVARILEMLKSHETLTPRCWSTIYGAFTATNVLLFGAARSLRDHVVGDVDDQLSQANTCLASLHYYALSDPVSARFHSMMKPTYDALRKLQHRAYEGSRRGISLSLSLRSSIFREDGNHPTPDNNRIRINDLLESPASASPTSSNSYGDNTETRRAISEEAGGVVIHTAMLLRDPFGKMQSGQIRGFGVGDYATPPPTEMTGFWLR